MFNIENADEVKAGKKPFVSERGPYSYREHRFKANITWDNKNSTVTYNERQWFVFDPSTSCSSCDPFKDKVTTLNIPLITIENAIKNISDTLDWKELFFDTLLKLFKDQLFPNRTVQELLWGYPDPLLQEYAKLRTKLPFSLFNLPELNPIIALQMNDTYQGVTTVHTGAKDISMIEKWTKWNGRSDVGVWSTPYANMLNGSDGTQFPPQQNTGSKLYVFVTQLCRSLYLTYDCASVVRGLDTLSFTTPKEIYLNSTLNPDNKAFCTKRCYPTGILDIGICQKSPLSLPIFISAPHFYLGDKLLTENVLGLSPNKQEHGTFLEIEPHLGVPLNSAKRLQINVFIEAIKHIDETKSLKTLFLPIMYINESSMVTASQAAMIKDKVIEPITVAHILELTVVVLGAVLFLLALVFLVLLINRNRKLKKIKTMIIPTVPSENSPLIVNT